MLHSPRDTSGILCTKWSKIKTSFFLRSTLKKKIVSKIKLICKPKNAFPTFNIAKYIVFTQTCCIFLGGRDTHFLQQNATHHPGHRPPIAQLIAHPSPSSLPLDKYCIARPAWQYLLLAGGGISRPWLPPP